MHCMREFCRIMSKAEDHILKKLVDESTRKGLQFCPLEYMRIMSRQLISVIGECRIVNDRVYRECNQSTRCTSVSRLDIVQRGSYEVHVVNEFLTNTIGKSVLIFTDGSVRCIEERAVGPGACAAVMFPLQGDGVEVMFTKAVGKLIDSVSCEVEGIILGLEKVVDYFNATIYRKFDEVLYILCDCDRAIDYVLDKNLECSSALKRRFDAYVNQLEQAKVKVFLVWIPSHSNIQGNEIADTLAKQVAKDIETNRIAVPNVIKLNSAFTLASDIARQSWQRKWDQGCSGTLTRQLIPAVCSKVCFPHTRNVGISYCRMLLNNTMLNEDSYRTQTNDTPVCDCGMDYESVEHFLLECQLHSKYRNIMYENINEVLQLRKESLHVKISLGLLLGYQWEDGVSKSQDSKIKKFVFQFIASTGRKL